MMCYRDRTFCDFKDCRKWPECKDALTEDVMAAAGRWWKAGGGHEDDAPIARYADRPECWEGE